MKYVKFLKVLAILVLPSVFLLNANAASLPVKVAQGDIPIATCSTGDYCIYLQRDGSIPDSQSLKSDCLLSFKVNNQPFNQPFTNWWGSHALQITDISGDLSSFSDLSFSISSINGKKTSSCSLSVNGSLAPALKVMQVSYDPNSSTYNCKVIR